MRSLKRAFAVVAAIGESSIGLGLQDLATQLDVPPASMHRLLAALEDEGLVVRSPASKRYFIGPNAISFGHASARSKRLHQIPPGPIARAAVASGQTLFLTEMIEGRAVCVAIAQGRRQTKLHAVLGREMPIHAAASARILMLDVADDQILGLLQQYTLDRREAHTPTTPEEVLARIQLARRRGYDLCDNELDRGKWGVSVPVRDGAGRTRQGVTLITDGDRTRRHGTRENLIRLTRNAAAELSMAARDVGGVPAQNVGTGVGQHSLPATSVGRVADGEVKPMRRPAVVTPSWRSGIG